MRPALAATTFASLALAALASLSGCCMGAGLDAMDVLTPASEVARPTRAWLVEGGQGVVLETSLRSRASLEPHRGDLREGTYRLRFAAPGPLRAAEGLEAVDVDRVLRRTPDVEGREIAVYSERQYRRLTLQEKGAYAINPLHGASPYVVIPARGPLVLVLDDGAHPLDPVCVERNGLALVLLPVYVPMMIACALGDVALTPAYAVYVAAGWDPVTGRRRDAGTMDRLVGSPVLSDER